IGKPRYVPSELVADITEGEIRLSVTKDEFERLGEYLEPATSLQVEGDNKAESGLAADTREALGKAVAPIQKHETPMNPWRRLGQHVARAPERVERLHEPELADVP